MIRSCDHVMVSPCDAVPSLNLLAAMQGDSLPGFERGVVFKLLVPPKLELLENLSTNGGHPTRVCTTTAFTTNDPALHELKKRLWQSQKRTHHSVSNDW